MSMRMCSGRARELGPDAVWIHDGGPSCTKCKEEGPYACEKKDIEKVFKLSKKDRKEQEEREFRQALLKELRAIKDAINLLNLR